MMLNETNPPLEEALTHYGVKGMRWGQRRAERAEFKARTKAAKSLEKEYDDEENYERRKKIIAGVALVGVGTVATAVILHKSGHLKVGREAFSKYRDVQKLAGQAERARAGNAARKVAESVRSTGKEYDDAYRDAGRQAYGAYKKSNFANRTFRPENVSNPLWTKNPKTPQAARDFVDAGFGKGGVFNVTTMSKGSERVNNFGPDVWDIPMLALTSGRK